MTFTLNDYINTLHRDVHQWYGWSQADGKGAIYSNLIIHNDAITKPTEQECIDGVIALQAEYDSKQYARDRAKAYPSLTEQADMAYWDRQNNTTTLDDAISDIKARFPK